MVTYRENSRRSTAWWQALIFNGLMFLLPIIAARAVVMAFAGGGIGQAPTPEALAETRLNIEASFERMVPRGTDEQVFWASLVERELRAKDLSAARGFLLAAPQMFNRNDTNAVRAAAKAEVTGTEDERLARAAMIFLPNTVLNKYLAASRPPSMDLPETAPVEGDDALLTASDPQPLPPAADTAAPTPTTAFSVLGDLEDLAANSRRWLNGDEQDSFILRLTGLVMVDPDVPPSVNLEEAASILKGAHRAGRISPAYLSILSSRLDDVIPEDELRIHLTEALNEVAPMSVLGERVKAAFADTIDETRLPRLTVEVELINRIADATSPSGAIDLLEYVNGVDDMRRARLISEAGGDRASALVKQIGPDALNLARAGVQLTGPLILQLMMLVAAALALTLAFASAVQRSLSSRPRKAAIY